MPDSTSFFNACFENIIANDDDLGDINFALKSLFTDMMAALDRQPSGAELDDILAVVHKVVDFALFPASPKRG